MRVPPVQQAATVRVPATDRVHPLEEVLLAVAHHTRALHQVPDRT